MKKIGFKELLDNDRFLWFFSFLFAVVTWFMVVSSVDTSAEKTVRNVPVRFNIEDSSLASLGLEPVLREDVLVEVLMSGERGILGGITRDDVIIEAELTGISEPGEHTLRLYAGDRMLSDVNVISIFPKEVTVRFDRIVTRELPITVDLSGVSYPDGYMLGDEYTNIQTVTVVGPETEMSQVYSSAAKLNLTRTLSRTEVVTAELVLLDQDGSEIETEHIEMSADTVDITIPVLKTKTLPLTVNFINTPATFPLDDLNYTLSRESVLVAGPAATVDSMSEINLGYIDFRDLDAGEYNFSLVLPAGFVNVEGVDTVSVVFSSDSIATTTMNITNITMVNKPADVNVTVLSTAIQNVRLYGDRDVLSRLTSQDLVAEIDLSGRELRNGTTRVTVNISAPNKGVVWAYGTYQAQISVQNS